MPRVACLPRSPSNPPAAFGGTPCEGDSQELQACYTECGTGMAKAHLPMPGPHDGRGPLSPLGGESAKLLHLGTTSGLILLGGLW